MPFRLVPTIWYMVPGKVCRDKYQSKMGINSGLSNNIVQYGYSLGGLKQTRNNLLDIDVWRRNSDVHGYQVYHLKRMSYLRSILINGIVAVGSRLWANTWLSNLETIPYSNRTHLVLVSRKEEKIVGEGRFNDFKENNQGKILAPIHPTSARVTLIAQNMIRALETDLREQDKVSVGSNYSSTSCRIKAFSSPFWQELVEGFSRKMGEAHGLSRGSRYLDHVEWEVIVVDGPECNAYSYRGGKIALFTGRLKHLESDAEIATVIGHEMAHVVARHTVERDTVKMGFNTIKRLLSHFGMSDTLEKWSSLFVMLPLSRKMELEADYIGLMLMASAGYDPRVVIGVREKFAKVRGDTLRTKIWCTSTHPDVKERVDVIKKAQEEAMNLYRESTDRDQTP